MHPVWLQLVGEWQMLQWLSQEALSQIALSPAFCLALRVPC